MRWEILFVFFTELNKKYQCSTCKNKNSKIMEKKIKAQIRQTNIQNLNELSEEEKFEFQKTLEKELKDKNEEIKILIKDINSNK